VRDAGNADQADRISQVVSLPATRPEHGEGSEDQLAVYKNEFRKFQGARRESRMLVELILDRPELELGRFAFWKPDP